MSPPRSRQLLVAVKLEVEQSSAALERAEQLFELGSLALTAVRSGPAVVASDLRTDDQGFIRILVCNDGLSPGRLGAGLWRVEADPEELEAGILNLAVNARDVMPKDGRLTLETGNAHIAEAYVAIGLRSAVRDGHIKGVTLVSKRACEEGAAFVVTDELSVAASGRSPITGTLAVELFG